MESPNTKTIIQRKKTVASDASPSYTKHSKNKPHSKLYVSNKNV